MQTFQLTVLSVDKQFYKGPCEMLVFDSLDGEIGILPKHEDMVAVVIAGELRFQINGEWKYAAVSEGFAEVLSDTVTLLAHTVEWPEDIDRKRAEEEAELASEILRQKQSMRESYQAKLTLAKAMARLKVTSRRGGF